MAAVIGVVVALAVTVASCSAPGVPPAPEARPTAQLDPAPGQDRPEGATVLPNGRLVQPAGRSSDLGDFPVDLAVSPDGRLAVALNAGVGTGLNGGFGSNCDGGGRANQCGYVPAQLVGDPATPAPDESLSVVDLTTGNVVDVTAVPTGRDRNAPQSNSFGMGLTFSPDGRHLYATGGGNNELYDFTVDGGRLLTPPRSVTLPSVIGPKKPAGLLGQISGYTKDVAVTPDGASILVVKEYDADVTVLDAATLQVRQQLPLDLPTPIFGSYLYGIVVSPDGNRGFVTAQGTGDVVVLERRPDGSWWPGENVGRHPVGDHPTGLALSPDGSELMVTSTNEDSVAVLDARTMRLRQKIGLHVIDGETWGSFPLSVAYAPDGRRAYVALAGDDTVAVLDRGDAGWGVAGHLPVGWYPSAVAVRPGSGEVLAVSAKGLGSRYPSDGIYPQPTRGGPQAIPNSYYYDGNNMPGLLSAIAAPDPAQLASGTETARRAIRFATDGNVRPPRSPIPTGPGGGSPIKHVVYIVRENRTFDQVFGDLGRTRRDVDADPSFELLASATPNAHRIQSQFATSDRFFSDGEASVQGHWWTTAASVTDFVEKSWRQNYSDRGRPAADWLLGVGQPRGCSIFQAAEQRVAEQPGFTYRDFGEPVGALNLSTYRDPAGCPSIPLERFDIPFLLEGLKGDATGADDRGPARAFLKAVGLDEQGRPTGGPERLPNFSYVTLRGDHTTGFGGVHTPRAQVAQNDAALGIILAALSRSEYWKDTAVMVVEDDSQDGADHIDGHRNILLVASPWARHTAADGATPGYVSHRHLDQSSVVRTIGLILGFPPMSSFEQFSPPLYDLFQDKDDPAELTAEDLAPVDLAPAPPFIDELTADYRKPNAAALREASAGLDLTQIDRAGPQLEAVLWQSIKDEPMPDELLRRLEQPVREREDDDG